MESPGSSRETMWRRPAALTLMHSYINSLVSSSFEIDSIVVCVDDLFIIVTSGTHCHTLRLTLELLRRLRDVISNLSPDWLAALRACIETSNMAGLPEHSDVNAHSTTDSSPLRRLPYSPGVRNESGLLQPSVTPVNEQHRNDLPIEDQENVPPATSAHTQQEGSLLLLSKQEHTKEATCDGDSTSQLVPNSDVAISEDLENVQPTTAYDLRSSKPVYVAINKLPLQLNRGGRHEDIQDPIEKELLELYGDIKATEKNEQVITIWTKDKGFEPNCDQARILKYLSLNNKLNSNGKASKGCVACGRTKNQKPKGHVWPKGLLKVAMNVHCPGVTNFILNLSDGKLMGTNGPTVRLLCTTCEQMDEPFENEMRNTYLKLLSQKGSETVCEYMQHERVRYMLVKIIFLGMMINIDVQKELEDKEFEKVFFDLWKYYNFSNDHTVPVPSPDVRLFIVPSEFPERILRNMAFTSVVRRDGSTFLYAKFDIFHVVVPVNASSQSLFGKYHNCLQPDGLYRSNVSEESSPQRDIQPGSRSFPEILIGENKAFEQKYVSITKDEAHFLLEFLKKTEEPVHKAVDKDVLKAREISPFCSWHKVEQLEQQIDELEQALQAETQTRRFAEMESEFYKEKSERLEKENINLKEQALVLCLLCVLSISCSNL